MASFKRSVALFAAFCLAPIVAGAALAGDEPSGFSQREKNDARVGDSMGDFSIPCIPLPPLKARYEAEGAFWGELTHENWAYLRGYYVGRAEPFDVPPMGDRAVLVTFPKNKIINGKPAPGGGVVLFVDGDQACTPMLIDAADIAILLGHANGEPWHFHQPGRDS